MRINYVSHGISILSGGARTIVELANRLADRGHEVSITTLRYKGEMELLKKANIKPRFKIIFAPLAGSYPYRAVKRIFRDTPFAFYPYVENRLLMRVMPECDANVALQSYTAFPVYESGRGKPFHHFMHYEPIPLAETGVTSDQIRMIEESYFVPTVKILNSTWLQRMMKEKLGIIVPDSQLVNHGFCSEYFHPRPEIKKDPNKKRIVALGKRTAFKGLGDLLAAFRIVYEKNKEVQLDLFVSEDLDLPKDLPIKIYKSVVNDELGKLYNSADVMVMPSWYESFPWPPIEAMASGTPVVTTRYGTEDFAVNEVNSLVIDPKSPEQMANAIMRVLDDSALRDKIISNGLKTAKQFTWERLTDQVEKIFKDNI